MRSVFFTAFSALSIALPVLSLSHRSSQPSVAQGNVLRPIAIRDFEEATGLERRDDKEDFSDLDPKTQAELIYGTPGGLYSLTCKVLSSHILDSGQLILANVTLYGEDGLEIVMMERFEGLTSAVDCSSEGDGQLSLSFKSQDAYKHALKQWDFINQSDNGTFLLIANHDGCGPDGERQAYL